MAVSCRASHRNALREVETPLRPLAEHRVSSASIPASAAQPKLAACVTSYSHSHNIHKHQARHRSSDQAGRRRVDNWGDSSRDDMRSDARSDTANNGNRRPSPIRR
jgi:hypothetical protein